MNDTQAYKAKTPLSASPATGSTSTITAPEGQLAWFVSVSVQDAYVVFDDANSTPAATLGVTLPAGFAGFIPCRGNIYTRAATTGAIVNAIPFKG